MALDNRLLQIRQDAQDIVRLSTIGANKIVELELDTITYTVKNNAGTVVGKFEGRDNQETAHNFASDRDKETPWEYPHTVEAQSNIKLNSDKSIDIGQSKFGSVFPTEKIKSITLMIENNTDCDYIEQMIEDELAKLAENVQAAVSETLNLAAINGLLNLPSDPLKILSWARKVVNTFFGPYTMALIDLALNLAEFAGALASLAGAAAAARANLKACLITKFDEANDKILDTIDGSLNTVFKDYDGVMDKLEEAQSELSKVTGSPKRFLPNREGLTLGEGITQSARSKLTDAQRDQYETERQAERDKISANLKKLSGTSFSNTAIASFKSDLAAYQAVPLADDPKAQADADAAANAMNEALGLPPLGSAVPGNVEVVIDGATFTFQNGIMVQATGTNSGTGTGISTNSVTSLPNVNSFLGAEWDGTLPAHVELITKIDNYSTAAVAGTGIHPHAGDHPHGEIGPFSTPSFANAITKKWPLPNNLKVVSAKFSLRNDRGGFGDGKFSFVDGAGLQDHWRSNVGTVNTSFIYWFSATPGGSPMTDVYGTPIVRGGSGSDNDIRFVQGYDASLLTDDGVFNSVNAISGGQIGVVRNSAGVADEPFYADSGEDAYVMLPIATKTFFFNTALVEATAGDTFIANGTIPGASDLRQYVPDPAKTGDDYQFYLRNVSNQLRVMQGSITGDVNLSLTDFLTKTFIRTDSANTIYNGTDATMEPFIGSTWGGTYPSDTQLITSWNYTDGTSVGANTDIGFVSDTPMTTKARKYPIPTNGKISTSDFSVGWGGFFTDNVYDYYFDRNNSTFDLAWSTSDDNLGRAWYDLDLMPVAWMSDEPGGSPKTLVDGSTGKVIKLERNGATYKGQQLLSTTNSLASDRATFPIVQKKFFLNVAVVSANVATTIVAAGTAPTANQLISWSVSDPALGYTGSAEQFLKFELGSRTNDKSDQKIPRR